MQIHHNYTAILNCISIEAGGLSDLKQYSATTINIWWISTHAIHHCLYNVLLGENANTRQLYLYSDAELYSGVIRFGAFIFKWIE